MNIVGPKLVWFPDPSSGGEREGSGELPQLAQIHGCIPAISVDEGKNAT